MKKISHIYTAITLFACILMAFPREAFSQVKYEIYAIKFGERTNKIPIADAAVGAAGNDSLNVCLMYWLLKGNNGKNILVDAGFTGDSEINPKFISFSPPDKMLEKINMKAADITDIIITHPHWDHIGGIDLYPGAMVWMQQADYDYFVDDAWQKDGNKGGFNEKDVLKIVTRNLDGNLMLVKGDNIEIIPGVKVFIGAKHTFESQYVMVGTGDDKVIIASDNCWFYYNLAHLLPIPVTHNANAYKNNLARMKLMIPDKDYIIPGHDPLVFSKFPSVAEGVVKIK